MLTHRLSSFVTELSLLIKASDWVPRGAPLQAAQPSRQVVLGSLEAGVSRQPLPTRLCGRLAHSLRPSLQSQMLLEGGKGDRVFPSGDVRRREYTANKNVTQWDRVRPESAGPSSNTKPARPNSQRHCPGHPCGLVPSCRALSSVPRACSLMSVCRECVQT